MKMKELMQKPMEELQKMLRELEGTRASLQFAVMAGQEKNVRKLRTCKRDIARVQTRITQLHSVGLTDAKK